MWVLKLKIRHDCTIGNRCRKFKVISHSLTLGHWSEKGFHYTVERHTLEGDPVSVKRFISDFRREPRILTSEISGNTIFMIGKTKTRIPSTFYSQKMFFTKPIYVDKQGFETWELASYEKAILGEFAEGIRKQRFPHFEILQFKNTKLDNVFFPSIAPNLTEKQKRVFDLAVENGYYDIPKRTDLAHIAKALKISIATCQEHLKRAEAKVIPKLKYF